jgi:hypothetical protein
MHKKKAISNDINQFGGAVEPQVTSRQFKVRAGRIPHSKLLRDLQLSGTVPNTLIEIYQKSVLSGKTRMIQLLGRKHPARILNTLLGYEVQASYKRIQCPDMATARYVKLFTELGCHSIRLPYDPSVTASILPDMEASIVNISKGISTLFPNDQAVQNYVLQRVYGIIREQLRKSV